MGLFSIGWVTDDAFKVSPFCEGPFSIRVGEYVNCRCHNLSFLTIKGFLSLNGI